MKSGLKARNFVQVILKMNILLTVLTSWKMAASSLFKTVNLRHLRVEAFFILSLYQIENGEKSVFLCLKEIVQNGSANILDFKINICYEIFEKKQM